MRIRALVTAAALSAVAAPALAADLGTPEPVPPAPAAMPVAAPAPTWSGFYIGALLGYTWGDSDTNAVGNVDSDGIDGGAYAGANYQFDQFVVGVEGDVLASGVKDDNGGLGVEQGWNGSLRARAGIALDNFLLYGTGGAAVTNVELKSGGASQDKTLWGWTAGVGAEALVTDNITARVEYRYADYEDKTFNLGGPVRSDLSTHSVRAGVGFKF